MLRSRRLLGVSAFLALAVPIGCQSVGGSPSPTSGEPSRAVIVTGAHGTSTTIYIPSTNGQGTTILGTAGSSACPECQAAAIEYARTGMLAANCTRTGSTRVAATAISTTSGHN